MTELAVLITEAFSNLDLHEYLDKKGIVVAGIKAGKDDDSIMMELVNAGVLIRDAYGKFRTAMMAAGFLFKPKDRNEKLAILLKDFAPESGTDVSDKLKELMDEIPRTTERQVMAAIRKYAKDNKIELPKIKRIGGWKKKLTDWIVDNPTASVDELAAYVDELGRPDSIAKRYTETMLLANRIAAWSSAHVFSPFYWAYHAPIEQKIHLSGCPYFRDHLKHRSREEVYYVRSRAVFRGPKYFS